MFCFTNASKTYGAFLKWGDPQFAGWFMRENPIEMDDDWGYPYFRKPPYHSRSFHWLFLFFGFWKPIFPWFSQQKSVAKAADCRQPHVSQTRPTADSRPWRSLGLGLPGSDENRENPRRLGPFDIIQHGKSYRNLSWNPTEVLQLVGGYIGNHHPNWLSYCSEGVAQPPTRQECWNPDGKMMKTMSVFCFCESCTDIIGMLQQRKSRSWNFSCQDRWTPRV